MALTHLVGQSRAYLMQLNLAKAELAGLHHDDLTLVLRAVDADEFVVKAVDSVGTEKLRAGR